MIINVNVSQPEKQIRKYTFKNSSGIDMPLFNIGKDSYIVSAEINALPDSGEQLSIHIGNFTSVANRNIWLINLNHDYQSISTSPCIPSSNSIKRKGQLIIGHDVWIGNDVTLMSGITIGNGAVIGAGAVVAKSVPPYAIVVGNPAKIIKYRFTGEQIDKLQKIKWWNWDYNKIEENKSWFSKDIDSFINKHYYEMETQIFQPIKMEVKDTSFVIYPDFNCNNPVWKKVIIEYCNRFSVEDNVSLVLRIKNDINFEAQVDEVIKIIENKMNLPDILIVNDDVKDERSIIQNVNYFITTREEDTLQHIEYAHDVNVNVISGVDIPVFDMLSFY